MRQMIIKFLFSDKTGWSHGFLPFAKSYGRKYFFRDDKSVKKLLTLHTGICDSSDFSNNGLWRRGLREPFEDELIKGPFSSQGKA